MILSPCRRRSLGLSARVLSVSLILMVFQGVGVHCQAWPAESPSGAAEFVGDPGDGYTYLGKVRPRHAREVQSSNWSVGAETMDRDFTVYAHWKNYLGPLGVKKARIQSGWAKTEKEKGKYDWAWLDEIVFDMVDQGVEPWVCLCYGNPVYEGGGGTGLGGGLPQSEQALEAWDRYVAAVVDRYKKHVDDWEVWNEPDLRQANAAGHYADFLVRTAQTVRRQQPDAKILGFAMAGIRLPWVRQVLDLVKQQDKLDLIDELTYHPYSYNPDDSYKAVQQLQALVHSYSTKIALRQGENGAPSQRGSFGALADYDWTEARQAKWALRRLLGDLGRDIPTSYFSICDMQYPDRRNYKGLLAIHDDKTVDHAKKAYGAVQNVAAVFDSTVRRIGDFDARIDGAAPSSTFAVFAYRKDNGGPIVTVWRSSDRPGARPDAEPVTVSLPGLKFEEPVWVDLATGRVYKIADSLWTQDQDTASFQEVPVYDSVVLIAERSALPLAAEAEQGSANP
jgi:hypothetical protein